MRNSIIYLSFALTLLCAFLIVSNQRKPTAVKETGGEWSSITYYDSQLVLIRGDEVFTSYDGLHWNKALTPTPNVKLK